MPERNISPCKGTLKQNVIEEGETKEEFTKRKRVKERRLTLHDGKYQEPCTQVFMKVDMEWVFEERDRGHVIFSSGAGTKKQFNQTSFM